MDMWAGHLPRFPVTEYVCWVYQDVTWTIIDKREIDWWYTLSECVSWCEDVIGGRHMWDCVVLTRTVIEGRSYEASGT